MEPATIILHVIAGGLLGMLGQGIRVIAGLKKANDEAAAQNSELRDVFRLNELLISLFIGFIAGALALLVTSIGGDAGAAGAAGVASPAEPFKLGRDAILAIVAAGYAGTDFIEAFMRKHLPEQPPKQQGAAVNSHDAQPPVG